MRDRRRMGAGGGTVEDVGRWRRAATELANLEQCPRKTSESRSLRESRTRTAPARYATLEAMAAAASPAQSRPEARAFRVEELVAHARAGRIRVPRFQRGFKWEREDVKKLLDSIWRGYPIGTLLLWSKVGPPGRVSLGDLEFNVSEQQTAWFVVDGQQRIVSMVSTLLLQSARGKKFDLYFDLVTSEILWPGRTGVTPSFLPLDRVVDSEDLLAWVDDNRAALTPEQIRLAIRVGKALREYEVPAYVVNVDDESVVREIFSRTNATGKALEASEVFNALHAPADRQPAVSLRDVVDRLRQHSLGELQEDHVLRSLLAITNKDPSGDLQRQLGDLDVPAAVERTERALARVLGFLAQDAGIPHLRLLPYRSALTALSAYFDRFALPSSRARRLLTRWLWRGSATGELKGDGTGMRPALEAIRSADDDETAAHGVLASVDARRPHGGEGEPFNLRFARSRLSLIALIELRPHDLRTGMPIDVNALLASEDDLALQIFVSRPAGLTPDDASLYSSVGNRILHPGGRSAVSGALATAARSGQPEAAHLDGGGATPHVLASHAITAPAIAALRGADRVGFLRIRREVLDVATTRLIDRHAEWSHSDRVSLAALSRGDD